MNREIRFRVWHKPTETTSGYYNYLDLSSYLGATGLLDSDVDNEDGIWEQCTGLIDVNGTPIYENDILEFEDHDYVDPDVVSHTRVRITWSEDDAAFVADGFVFWKLVEYKHAAVVGNREKTPQYYG